MTSLWAWIRWEASRTIEVTGFIVFIIVERFVKGAALMLGGLALVVAGETTDLHRFAVDFQESLELQAHESLWRRGVSYLLDRLGSLSTLKRNELAVAVMLYGALEIVEGVGLVRRRRWAEYLVLIATCAFLPLEVDELTRRVTVLKVGALVVNLAIVAYLVWRKRLFLERPSTTTAASPA